MLRILLILLTPLLLLALLEVAFENGIWEPLAQPMSHAGTSVHLKQALSDASIPSVDYVTLGSSRPEYGLDHALLATTANQAGRVHANLAMPGSHWLTIGLLAEWLQRAHPEVHGGIIALSIQDLINPGNGSYELGIVQPFRHFGDIGMVTEHVAFNRADVATYGIYSALFGWRADIQEFVRHPFARKSVLHWFKHNRPPAYTLFENPESHGDMCAFGLDAISACDKVDASSDPERDGLKRQCKELRGNAVGRPDFGALAQQKPLPDFMKRTRDIVQAQLRAIPWPKPPLVVLMPVPRIWTRDVLGTGLHEWALAILRPLADEGRIHLIDATDFFAPDADAGCSAFFDFYHQNALGRERLTHWLLPQVERFLYRDDPSRDTKTSAIPPTESSP
ncbi:MAG: hypothetical protein ABIO49_03940 [Dokdonella sp.]